MIANSSRLFLCIAALLCLAGCGGSSKSGSSGGGGGTPPAPTIVTYTFTGTAPSAVATQIGTAAYTQATLQSGKLVITLPSSTSNYSVAIACPRFTAIPVVNRELVVNANAQDGSLFSEYCSTSSSTQSGLVTLQVDASAISGAAVLVIADEIQLSVPPNGIVNYSGELNLESSDLFVVAYDSHFKPLAIRVLRSQAIPGALNGGNPVVFTVGDEPVTQTITYSSTPNGFSDGAAFDFFTTSGGASLVLSSVDLPATEYRAMPPTALRSGDYYTLETDAFLNLNNDNNTEVVGLDQAFSAAGPKAIAYPTPWTYSGPTPAALPTFDFDYPGFSGMSSIVQHAQLTWYLETTPSEFSINISTTQNYQGSANSVSMPDLSTLTGFLSPPASGTTVDWFADIEQGSALSASLVSGTVQVVSNSGFYTEP